MDLKKKIKIEYLLGRWNPQTWEGTVEEAMKIALGEIFEHEGASSPAYIFTEKVFNILSLSDES